MVFKIKVITEYPDLYSESTWEVEEIIFDKIASLLCDAHRENKAEILS
jgi:hypothetical protein